MPGKVGRPVGYRTGPEVRLKISKALIKHHNKVSKDDRKKIVELYYSRTMSIKTIASMYGITDKHIFTLISKYREED